MHYSQTSHHQKQIYICYRALHLCTFQLCATQFLEQKRFFERYVNIVIEFLMNLLSSIGKAAPLVVQCPSIFMLSSSNYLINVIFLNAFPYPLICKTVLFGIHTSWIFLILNLLFNMLLSQVISKREFNLVMIFL